MKICDSCKTVVEDTAMYCPQCGGTDFSPFKTKRCVFCGQEVAELTIVCPNCHRILPPDEATYKSRSAKRQTRTANEPLQKRAIYTGANSSNAKNTAENDKSKEIDSNGVQAGKEVNKPGLDGDLPIDLFRDEIKPIFDNVPADYTADQSFNPFGASIKPLPINEPLETKVNDKDEQPEEISSDFTPREFLDFPTIERRKNDAPSVMTGNSNGETSSNQESLLSNTKKEKKFKEVKPPKLAKVKKAKPQKNKKADGGGNVFVFIALAATVAAIVVSIGIYAIIKNASGSFSGAALSTILFPDVIRHAIEKTFSYEIYFTWAKTLSGFNATMFNYLPLIGIITYALALLGAIFELFSFGKSKSVANIAAFFITVAFIGSLIIGVITYVCFGFDSIGYGEYALVGGLAIAAIFEKIGSFRKIA